LDNAVTNDNQSDSSIDHYLQYLRTQRNLSPHTVSNYALDLAELCRMADKIALSKLTYHHVRRFTSQLHAQGLNPRSISRKLSCWRGFFNWLGEQIDMPANPVDGIKAPKKSKSLPKALGADDAVRLVSQATNDKTIRITESCNRAMFELLYSSGLRVSELVSLDIADVNEQGYSSLGWIDLAQGEVHVTGKGNKQRIVPVGTPALNAIRDWLSVRPTLVKAEPHPLFLNERGARMAVRTVQLRLKAHARSLDIPANVTPHVLRHSFATHVLQSSGDLRAVQEMLGHSSISATQVYTSLDFQHLAQVYDKTHPRAKK
jgi:integrase/recombinase XerC